ncbi:hypothetical protein BJ165DRAFT_1409731 [Panaeolus papilionaceus]|nr:hypothetical protein BJ165DRAFT_1409731 [Panaeolus papilionaceus]
MCTRPRSVKRLTNIFANAFPFNFSVDSTNTRTADENVGTVNPSWNQWRAPMTSTISRKAGDKEVAETRHASGWTALTKATPKRGRGRPHGLKDKKPRKLPPQKPRSPKAPLLNRQTAIKKRFRRRRTLQSTVSPEGQPFVQLTHNMCDVVGCYTIFSSQAALKDHLFSSHNLKRGKCSGHGYVEIDNCPWQRCGKALQRRSIHRHIVNTHLERDGNMMDGAVLDADQSEGTDAGGVAGPPSPGSEDEVLSAIVEPVLSRVNKQCKVPV